MPRRSLALATIGALAGASAALGLMLTRPAAPPTYEAVRAAWQPSDAWLLDRRGEIIDSRRIDHGVRRLRWTALDEVSPALVDALIRGEDRRFWRHGGVDARALLAAFRDALQGRRRGASTITMQLADLLANDGASPRGGRTVVLKFTQMRRAWQLEAAWSKQQILEAYLNRLQFRGELQGVRAAASLLAGKTPAGLTSDEAAVLAALLPHPAAKPERVAQRACARRTPVADGCGRLRETALRLLTRTGSHALADEHLAPPLAARLLRTAGESVATTLDARLQRVAHAALARQLFGLATRNVRDGAAIVVDNRSGEVLAYVASAGPASTAAAVDGVRARRQAGSTLKPFLYQLALERRYLTAASLLDDSPVAIDTPNGIYLPKDYDHQYKGQVSVRQALAGSLNVPAVRTLMLVGTEDFRDRLNAVGYGGIDRDGAWYGLSLALGSAEVSLWEQARAYRGLALGGDAAPPLHVTDADAPDSPAASEPPRAPDARAGFIVADILADRGARAGTFGLDSSLATPYWAAVKTGTSKDMRDNWCVGFTRDYTVAVWVGNFEGDSMHDVSGVSGAAPAWREILDALHADGAPGAPAPPAGVASHALRFAGGLEPPRGEWFIDGTAPGAEVRPVDTRTRIARIASPVNGMVIALDPDIPPRLQRVPISVEGEAARHALAIDDEPIGAAAAMRLWTPTPGVHRVALLGEGGRVVDRVQFTVR